MRYVHTALLYLFVSFPAYALSGGLEYLPDAEQAYYNQIFDYTMDNIKAGEGYSWKSQNGQGTIDVEENFTSKSGYNCRPFRESIDVGGQKKNQRGVGCKREGRPGWCKLKPDNAMTCALEESSALLDKNMSMETGGDFKATINNSTNKLTRWLREFLANF